MPHRTRSIFLYEYATAGGAWGFLHDEDLVGALRVEGRAMAMALATDLRAAGFDVREARPSAPSGNAEAAFRDACAKADATWIIAPETRGILLALTEFAESLGARLLSPGSPFIHVTQDKHLTAEHLRGLGIRVPRGIAVMADFRGDVPWSGPSVIKPRDGAGSVGVALWNGSIPKSNAAGWRVEERLSGQSASVAVICRGAIQRTLLPCAQHLGGPDGLTYVGGSLPLPARLDARARALALDALEALPPTNGYVGVDLILGPAEDGTRDAIIEVNPRLTTSYIALRTASETNLAATCVATIEGGSPLLAWRPCRLEFLADGDVREAVCAERASDREDG